ncbi:MAG: hypothetical protein JXR20_07840 [Balneola sp.]
MKSILLITFVIFSLINCSNSKKTAEDSTQNKPVAELPLAPGQIQALLEIIDLETDTTQNIVSAKVLEVKNYGSSTSPVPTESIINFMVDSDTFKKLGNSLKPNATINAILSKIESGKSQKTSNYWKLISINN